eukprot:SAG31_NODE_15735_length_740_cov_9.753510_1_plen_92_part_01
MDAGKRYRAKQKEMRDRVTAATQVALRKRSLRPRTRPIPELKGERCWTPAVLVGSAAVTIEPPRQRVEPRRRRVPPVRLRPRREARLRLLLR